MKKIIVIFIFVFLFGLGLNMLLMAKENILEIEATKGIFSGNKELYVINLDIEGDTLKGVNEIIIRLPNKKKMTLGSTFGFGDMHFKTAVSDVSYEELIKTFPAGRYDIILFPRKYGSQKINLTYDNFPEAPKVTYPTNGDTNVPLTPTVEWEPLSGIDGLSICFADSPCFDLPTDATSFAVPSGLLEPDSEGAIDLIGSISNGKGMKWRTGAAIRFTTEAK